MLIGSPTITPAAHKDVLRHRPTSQHRPDSARPPSARSPACRSTGSLPPSAWLGLLTRRVLSAALGLARRLPSSYEQDFSPAGRGQGPWCELDGGSTLKQMGVDCTGGRRLSRWLSLRYSSLPALSPLYIWGSSSWCGRPGLACVASKQRQHAGVVPIQGPVSPGSGLATHSGSERPSNWR
jgi:hypothetical protein